MLAPAPDLEIQAAARLLAEGRAGEAARRLEALVGAAPVYPAALVLLARAYEAEGRSSDALAAWHRAHFLVPTSPLVLRERQRLLDAQARATGPVDFGAYAPRPPAPAEPPPDPPAEDAPPLAVEPGADLPDARLAVGAVPVEDVEPGGPDPDEAEEDLLTEALLAEAAAAPSEPIEDLDAPAAAADTEEAPAPEPPADEPPAEEAGGEPALVEEPPDDSVYHEGVSDERDEAAEAEAVEAPVGEPPGGEGEPGRPPIGDAPLPIAASPLTFEAGAEPITWLDVGEVPAGPPAETGEPAAPDPFDPAPAPAEDTFAADPFAAEPVFPAGPTPDEPADEEGMPEGVWYEEVSEDRTGDAFAAPAAESDDAPAHPPVEEPESTDAEMPPSEGFTLIEETDDAPPTGPAVDEPDVVPPVGTPVAWPFWAVVRRPADPGEEVIEEDAVDDEVNPRDETAPVPLEVSAQEIAPELEEEPPAEAPAADVPGPEPDAAVEDVPSAGPADDLEDLIRQLEGATRIRPDPHFVPSVSPEDEDGGLDDDLASETLARIYAAQRQFDEAAAIYEKLARQRPDEAERFLREAADLRARGA